MEIYWQDWTHDIYTAYIELIIHATLSIFGIILTIIYIRVFLIKKPLNVSKTSVNVTINISPPSPRGHQIEVSSRSFDLDALERAQKKLKHKQNVEDFPIELHLVLITCIILNLLNIYFHLWFSNLSILIFNIRYKYHCFYRILISVVTVGLQKYCVYLFFLWRVKNVFQNTVFRFNRVLYYFFVIISFVITIGNCWGYAKYTYTNPSFLCTDLPNFGTYVLITFVSDIVLSIIFSWIMIYKLKQIATKSDEVQQDLYALRLKLINLSLVSILCTMFLEIVIQTGLQMFGYQVQGIDMFINNICIMFSWTIFKEEHDFCCKYSLMCTAICTNYCICFGSYSGNEQNLEKEIKMDEMCSEKNGNIDGKVVEIETCSASPISLQLPDKILNKSRHIVRDNSER